MINGMSQVPSNLSAVVGLQPKWKNDRHWSHEYDGMASATSLATPLAVQTIQTVGDRHSPTPGFARLAPETASDGNDLHAPAAQPFLSTYCSCRRLDGYLRHAPFLMGVADAVPCRQRTFSIPHTERSYLRSSGGLWSCDRRPRLDTDVLLPHTIV